MSNASIFDEIKGTNIYLKNNNSTLFFRFFALLCVPLRPHFGYSGAKIGLELS